MNNIHRKLVSKLKIKVVSKMGEYLDSRGIKQAWLAKEIEADKTQVSNWCRNEQGVAKSTPSVGYIIKILGVLDCKVDDLWELKEE